MYSLPQSYNQTSKCKRCISSNAYFSAPNTVTNHIGGATEKAFFYHINENLCKDVKFNALQRFYHSKCPLDLLLCKMMLRKRYIIETINDLLKNKAQLVHSRHRSITNFLVNIVAVPGAYCFFENKPEALQGYCIEDSKQLTLF